LKRFIGAFASTVIRFFITGAATLLPLAVTGFAISWIVSVADVYIGPSSRFGVMLAKLAGPGHAYVGYLVGYLVAVLLIMLLGFLVTRATVSKFHKAIDSMFARIPLFGKIYAAVGQVVELFGKKNESNLEKFFGIVQIRMGNVKMLALLTSTERYVLADGREHLLVFLPNSPIPLTGFSMLVPVDQVNLLDMPVEDLAKLMMSLGLLGSQVLPGPLAKLAEKKQAK
jgi:uncharacterized membrane protein